MAFIIGTYNKYDSWDRQHARYKFMINEQWYAIKEVELEWGKPVLPMRVDIDERYDDYFIYDTYENAMEFVRRIKMMNAR